MTRFHIQLCHPIYCPNNQVCHGFSRGIRASSTFDHGTWNDSPLPNPLLPWVGPNLKVLSRWITLQQLELPTRLFCPAGPKWWICVFGCFAAAHPKINFNIAGMQVPRTGPTTTPNTTLTPTTKPIEARMQVTGPWWVLKPIPCLLLPISPQIFPRGFSIFQDKFSILLKLFGTKLHERMENLFPYMSYVYLQAEQYFPYIMNVVKRVCRSLDSWVWTDQPKI